jgi:transcriptional regulatory protein CAT8
MKDEQMEMLSRVEATLGSKARTSSNSSSSGHSISSGPALTPGKTPSEVEDYDEEHFLVKQMYDLALNGTYRGTSAGGVFVEAFLEKLRRKAPSVVLPVSRIAQRMADSSCCRKALPENTMPSPALSPDSIRESSPASCFPSRMTCDKLVTVYFQEWQSVFSILDQNVFLSEYQRFFDDDTASQTSASFPAMLALVLILSSLANKDASTAMSGTESRRLYSVIGSQTATNLAGVQVCALALLYSLHIGNLDDMWLYKSQATSLVFRLGLHRDPHSLRTPEGGMTPYEQDLRRRVFWAVYALDVFASTVLGSPRAFHDNTIECDMPQAIEDEIVVSAVITPPSNIPPVSCPLAMIQFSRVFANIIDTVYAPAQHSYPYKTIVMLDDQLETWKRELPTNLKFEFANGMPSATLTPVHQKSPLILMMYHYARILIHLPALTAPLDDASMTHGSGSNVAVMQSAKTYIQVSNYLKARNVAATLPLSPTRTTFLLGGIVLYGAVEYSKGGALLQQVRKIISNGLSYLYADMQANIPGSISQDCYQWLEETCDVILNGSQAPRKKSEPKTKEERQPRIKMESPPSYPPRQSRVKVESPANGAAEQNQLLDDILSLHKPWPKTQGYVAEGATSITIPRSPTTTATTDMFESCGFDDFSLADSTALMENFNWEVNWP